jgi:ribosomal protein S27AE
MYKISEEYLEEHMTDLVKCPKCDSSKVIAKTTDDGYFFIVKCNKCGYSEKNNKPGN